MHHAKITLATLALALVTSSCSGSHETLDATTGVYELTVTGEGDACSPARTTGPMGTAGVVQDGTRLAMTVPDLVTSAPMLLALEGGNGFSSERTDAVGTCSRATLARTYSVVGHDSRGFDVAYTETWTGLASCPAAARAAMPAAPSADCQADLVFRYRLRSACAAPCTVRLAADGSALCQC